MGEGLHSCRQIIQTTRLGGKYGLPSLLFPLNSSFSFLTFSLISFLIAVCSSPMEEVICCVVVIMFLLHSLQIPLFLVLFTATVTGTLSHFHFPFLFSIKWTCLLLYVQWCSGCRADANEAAVILLPSNITVFTLDFSGSGLSDGDYVSLGWHEVRCNFLLCIATLVCYFLCNLLSFLYGRKMTSR